MHVTVLMAVYNGARTVGDAIESICSQSYADWDLLIVDDGSSDDTWEILERYVAADPRIHAIRNPNNRGLAYSLNRGWQAADSSLIARMDADDVSVPERLQLQVDFMRLNPDVAVLGAGVLMVDDEGRTLGSVLPPELHRDLQAAMYKENPFAHPTVMMRRGFLETMGGYDERLRRAQDADLWLRGYRRFRYHNLQAPLVRYRLRRKPSFLSTAFSSFVLARSAWREGLLLKRGWCALRPIGAGFLIRTGAAINFRSS
ncbi:MAG TPA: glycosyltransferase [Bryobacteraceae bacterium]|nr:glycosyltransferase [Bryobacteraceae bacterium]